MAWGVVLSILGGILCFFSPMFLLSYIMGSSGHWSERALLQVYVVITILALGSGFYLINEANKASFERKCADKGGHVTEFHNPDKTTKKICVDSEGRLIQLS